MGGWSGVYTVSGLALLAKLSKGGVLDITRAVTGTGKVPVTDLAHQTRVTGEKQELAFQTPTYPEPNTCKLPVVLSNEGLSTGYTAHQIGFYAKDTDGTEILYFVAQSENGTNILPEMDISGYTATWIFYFNYGQADGVTVKVDPANAVTIDMLEEVRVIAERGVSAAMAGNVVVIDDCANLPVAALRIYGKSVQDGTPAPSAPIDIVSVAENGEVRLTINGANMCQLPEMTSTEIAGVTWAYANGAITANGTATAQSNVAPGVCPLALPCGAYTLSGGNHGVMVIAAVHNGDVKNYYTSKNGMAVSFEVVSGDTVYLYGQVGNGVTVNAVTVYPMICAGLIERDWEAYTGHSATLGVNNGLHGIPVESGGNYTDTHGQEWICDELDLVRGVHIQRVHEYQMTGAESWMVSGVQDNSGVTRYDGFVAALPPIKDKYDALCTHFPTCGPVGIGTWVMYNTESSMGVRVRWEFATLDELTTFLTAQHEAGTPVTIKYPLAVPIETPLTDIEIAACKALYAQNPTTTIFSDSGAEIYAECIRAVHESAFAMLISRDCDGTPDPHASSHKTGGSDPIAPADIGAAAATHAATHKTGGTDALKPADIGAAAASVDVSATLTAAGWSGTAAPYTQSVSISGMTANAKGSAGLAMSVTAAQVAAAQAAAIILTAQGSNTATFKAFGDKPTVNIPILVRIGG